ncbi:hypothetical protein DOTSEDRAFT_70083 [Dothistroma septosporum NZE10]|uniref:Protein kinase domain-containing protein n=1 Tax=Dothistroma septosporum (strain NZE10 / CBS 128990) TaxID=675120 RepID=N1PUC2_DOTSN|nr:hypothetical protein DOTSEDRAFT_70083 [Dothistroma septosporum NZE10]
MLQRFFFGILHRNARFTGTRLEGSPFSCTGDASHTTLTMAKASNDEQYRNIHGLLNRSWVAGPILGKGAYGAPQVWLKRNKHGRVIDRVAIKDTEITKSYPVTNDATPVPVEALAPIALQWLPDGHNVVSLRNWRQDED